MTKKYRRSKKNYKKNKSKRKRKTRKGGNPSNSMEVNNVPNHAKQISEIPTFGQQSDRNQLSNAIFYGSTLHRKMQLQRRRRRRKKRIKRSER